MKKIAIAVMFIFILSCEAIFVEDISNKSIDMLVPAQNTVINSGSINFSWQLLEDADSYRLQIVTPNFSNATQILLDSVTDLNSVNHELSVGNYEWRVKASNSEYETNYTTVAFTVN